jgi:D-3-phosphoglycerate dehydrogenase
MAGTVDSLILELLEWLSRGRRPYGEVLEGWRTSCPRLPVWEEANHRGSIKEQFIPGDGIADQLSPEGLAQLRSSRSHSPLLA